MKRFALCGLCLVLVVAAAVALGRGPTAERWGGEGLRSLYAVAVICLGAAIVALVPMAVLAVKRPGAVGPAALAATAIRLLLTMAAGGVYQVYAKPHLTSFLFWAAVIYCLLLAVETVFGVWMIRRCYPAPPGVKGASV